MRSSILPSVALALALGACTTTGVGSGTERGGPLSASFAWKENAPDGGTISATLSDGRTFAGDYFQVKQDATIDRYGPLWSGWTMRGRRGFDREWADWGPRTDFVTEYSGKVLANLATPNGQHMRCRFTLRDPSTGMADGGVGRCQLPAGGTIDATFPST